MIGTKFYKNKLDDNAYFDGAIWCNENGAMIEDKGDFFEIVALPAPTLEVVKEKKIADLKTERDTLEVDNITVNGHTFDYDEKARERINNAIIALQATGAAINWTTANHQSVSVTASDLVAVVARVAERSNALHIAYRRAKQAVIDAETVETVQAVKLEVIGETLQ